MANFRMGYIGKSFTMGVLGIVGTLVACGGGGVTSSVAQATATVSPYVLIASSYVPHPQAADDLKWRTAQGGDVYSGSGGNYVYDGYGTWDQNAIDYHQSVGIQFKHTAALGANDYLYTKIQTPGNAGINISESDKLIIQMGNGTDTSVNTNTTTVYTIEIAGGAYNAQSYTYANACTANVTLNTGATANNLRVYSVNLSQFTTCSAGTLAAAKADLKAVVIKVLSANDTNAASTTLNQVFPKIGLVAFSD